METYWPPGDPRDPKARARRTDPKTSHDAAAKVDITKAQSSVVMVLRHLGDATDEELIKGYQNLLTSPYWTRSIALQTDQSIRSRRAEMVRRGHIVDTGMKRPTVSGNPATVWRALSGNDIAARDPDVQANRRKMEKEERQRRTEGTLFDPDEGKVRRHDVSD